MESVVAERAFVAHRLARAYRAQAKQRRINAAFDDEVGLPAGTMAKAEASAQAGVGQTGFQVRAKCFPSPAKSAKQNQIEIQRWQTQLCLLIIALTCSTLTDMGLQVRFRSVSTITKTDSVWFTTKGQVVIPAWLRKQYHIEDGTKAMVQATPEGILLKPVTSVTIQRLRGILKRKSGDKPFAQEWAEHKAEEKALEEAKYARSTSSR